MQMENKRSLDGANQTNSSMVNNIIKTLFKSYKKS